MPADRTVFRAALILGIAGVGVFAALLWLTAEVNRIDEARRQSGEEAARHELVRIALWRMDSMVSSRVAREAARPYFEWTAFYGQGLAYTRLLEQVAAGEVLTPSPLLQSQGGMFPLYFQVDPRGRVSSPQVPTGNLLDLAQSTVLPNGVNPQAEALLAEAAPLLASVRFSGEIAATVAENELMACEPAESQARAVQGGTKGEEPADLKGKLRGLGSELQIRSKASNWAQQAEAQQFQSMDQAEPAKLAQVSSVTVGPFVPLWIAAPSPFLTLVRMVEGPTGQFAQGMVVDWPMLRNDLLNEIGDLLPDAELDPIDSSSEASTRLATLPALLLPGQISLTNSTASATSTSMVLTATWIAALGAMAAASAALFASIRYGQNQRRFASSVTHELRTPLTTFRLYSDLLAEGMVPDEATRRTYLTTIRSEAERLSQIVENVLAFSRVERGATRVTLHTVTAGDLCDRIFEAAQQVADLRKSQLTCTRPDPEKCRCSLQVDAGLLTQVVVNLVDNACKYAGDHGPIEMEVSGESEGLAVTVRDRGPGIPRRDRKRIFLPFERLAGIHTAPIGGAGLGLAIATSLTDAMGARISCKDPADGAGGIEFTIQLPAQSWLS